MKPIHFILVYIFIISLISIIITALDKSRAKSHKWRVRESTLLILSALGGSFAMFITMQIIRHKTHKPKFMVTIPVMIVIQAVLLYMAVRYVT